jgi:ribonuclease VapC
LRARLRAGRPEAMTEAEPDTPHDPGSHPGTLRVLDTSAVLALLLGEPGAETVAEAIADGAAISTVTHTEVATVLIRNDLDLASLAQVAAQVRVAPFTVADANTAAALIVQGGPLGLSLGDRACLALAIRLNARALTADSAWTKLEISVEVILIRTKRS